MAAQNPLIRSLEDTRNPAMRAVLRTAQQVAPTNIPVLLTGEPGTGKECLAQWLHEFSRRKDESFEPVRCASLTGGSVARYFACSSGSTESDRPTGTLFLIEISELDLLGQRELLYAFSNAGAEPDESYDGPRLISSTAVPLEEELGTRRFRAELFYRINGVELRLPALRERKEDVAPLTEMFLSRYAMHLGRSRPVLDAEDFSVLEACHWPGNVPQLENVAKKMVISNNPKSVISELHTELTGSSAFDGAKTSALKVATRAAVRSAEREMILAALGRTRWNRKRAAAELKISYKSLLCKLKEISPAPSKNLTGNEPKLMTPKRSHHVVATRTDA